MISYNITNDSITVIYQGKSHVVQKSSPQFPGLKQAILNERWDDVPNHLSVSKSLNTWARGKFTLDEASETFSYEGRKLPQSLNRRIITMASKGEDPTPLFNFFERLSRNPSMRSVEQLYPFLEHTGISISPDGCLLAYKGVTDDYKDCHTRKIDNKPGEVVKVPRNQVSDDPRQACHFGLHAGSKSYASGYGSRLTVVKIDPEHVVSVPYDSSEKLRCCEYKVLGNCGDSLSDTVHAEQELPPDEPEEADQIDESGADCIEDEGIVQESNLGEESLVDAEEDESDKEDESPTLNKTAGGVVIPKRYAKTAGKPIDELMKLSLDRLRELATYGLKIIGASKIPGGKAALVAKIIEVRGSRE